MNSNNYGNFKNRLNPIYTKLKKYSVMIFKKKIMLFFFVKQIQKRYIYLCFFTDLFRLYKNKFYVDKK